MKRLNFLDGLRGWGAVFVVLYHVFVDGLPVSAASGHLLGYLVPFKGVLAVFVFFLVSGFALSTRYLDDGDVRAWTRLAAGRYLRLAIPIFFACLIVHVAMTTGWVDPTSERLTPFNLFLSFTPTMGHLLRFSLFDVFFDYRFSDTYVGPLWTMSIEFIGSAVVLLAVLMLRPMPCRSAILLALACLLLLTPMPMLSLFPLGAAMADWFGRGWLNNIPKWISAPLLVVGCLIPALLPFRVWGMVAASAVMLGCIAMPEIRHFLSGRVSAELGRISFPLYLMHAPVMYIMSEPMMRWVGTSVDLRLAIDLLTIVVSFAAAYAFLLVNSHAVRLSRYFGRWVAFIVFYRPASFSAP